MKLNQLPLTASVGMALLLYGGSPASAQTAPPLGAVESFAVLGGSAVTAAGAAGTVIDGDVGSAPTPAVTGFPPAEVTSGFTVYESADPVTADARTDAATAYAELAGQVCPAGNTIAGGTLGGLNLAPGVYCMPTGTLAGTLTLTGGASDVWVFQITLDTLTTSAASSIVMSGGASACNVYWQVGTSATLGAGSFFKGSIFAGVSIRLGTTADVVGRVIAGSGAVTMDGSNTVGGCSAPAPPPPCPTIVLSPNTLPDGTVGVAYTQTLTASGGTAPYSFSVIAGTLPAEMTLTPAGVLSGTPTAAGSPEVTIRGTDENGCFADVVYTIVIAPAPPPPVECPLITLTPASLPQGAAWVAYNQMLAASGGIAPYGFGVVAGTLPAAVTLTSAGVLSGTPTAAGTSTFTIRATDADGCLGEGLFTIVFATAVPTLPQIFFIVLTIALIAVGYLRQCRRARAEDRPS